MQRTHLHPMDQREHLGRHVHLLLLEVLTDDAGRPPAPPYPSLGHWGTAGLPTLRTVKAALIIKTLPQEEHFLIEKTIRPATCL